MKKIELSRLKNVLTLQKDILAHFQKTTGITDEMDIRFLYVAKDFQSDCDGDGNKITVKITHKIGGIGKLDKPIIDIVKIHSVLAENFEMSPSVTQEISNFKNHPRVETTFKFNYYNFTEK